MDMEMSLIEKKQILFNAIKNRGDSNEIINAMMIIQNTKIQFVIKNFTS
jgi:hypothetical protein